jgi:hypothetical protein
MIKGLFFVFTIVVVIGLFHQIFTFERITSNKFKTEYRDINLSDNRHSATEAFATTGNVFFMHDKIRLHDRTRSLKSPTIQDSQSFLMDSYPMNKKWAVVTTIFGPTKLINTLSDMKDWCTVIIADQKSISKEKYMEQLTIKSDSCLVYLSIQDQASLNYSITNHIQFNSFGRKNIGYIFAIQHGAEVIYDTDDDNEISDKLLLEYWAMNDWILRTDTIFKWVTVGSNPYPTYGVEHIWPRGIPLNQVKDTSSYVSIPTTSEIKKTDICVVQSLANKEPDVDAIYRLTNPKYPVTFSSDQLFASQVREDQMAPFNAQATLFFKEAFALMLLPVTVHGRVSDIWRSYIAQAVMHCSLVFASPWVTQVRNSHNYMADFQAELPLYLQSAALVEHLIKQKGKYGSLSDAMIDSYEYGIVEQTDVDLVFAWENDLKRATQSAMQTKPLTLHKQPTLFRHLFVAMGRGQHLRQWKSMILNNEHLKHVDALLGVFDEPVEALDCGTTNRIQCVSSKDTTWATGRNALAKAAYRMEVNNNIKYTYWTFADADIVLACLIEGNPYLQTDDSCFVQYDSILEKSNWPIVTLTEKGRFSVMKDSVLIKIESFDGAWNSFHRDAVPVLLPYQSDLDLHTWWSSQAIFWYRVKCFTSQFALTPLTVFYINPEHNPYPKNARNAMDEISIGQRTLGKLAPALGLAPLDYPEQLTNEKIRLLHELGDSNWMHELDSYKICVREFSDGFYNFILN